MGGKSSKRNDNNEGDDKKKGITGSKDFGLWTLEDVEKARERIFKVPRGDHPHSIPISRRQFWELFSDYSKLIGTQFLSLPVDLFDVFCDEEGNSTINAIEVLLMLGLFCEGATDDQMTFCFNLFDFDGGGSIDKVRHFSCFVPLGCYMCDSAHSSLYHIHM